MKKVIKKSNGTNTGSNKFLNFSNNKITDMNIYKVKGGDGDDFVVEDLIDM